MVTCIRPFSVSTGGFQCRSRMNQLIRAGLLVAALAAIALMPRAASAAAMQEGEIRGTVIDAETNEPLVGANVFVVGTTLGAAVNADGTFRISRVPAGV